MSKIELDEALSSSSDDEIFDKPAKQLQNYHCDVASPQTNVFEFMMKSRHKSIGSNSSGKERQPETIDPSEVSKKKEKSLQRKSLFEEWAKEKGSVKRKLDDERQEKYVKKTMLKRAKHLKNTISNMGRISVVEDETNHHSSNRKVYVVESDDEDIETSAINSFSETVNAKSTKNLKNETDLVKRPGGRPRKQVHPDTSYEEEQNQEKRDRLSMPTINSTPKNSPNDVKKKQVINSFFKPVDVNSIENLKSEVKPGKRPRGRPRKQVNLNISYEEEQNQEKRGRLSMPIINSTPRNSLTDVRKTSAINSFSETVNANSTKNLKSETDLVKRPRGRPKKQVNLDTSLEDFETPKKEKHTRKAANRDSLNVSAKQEKVDSENIKNKPCDDIKSSAEISRSKKQSRLKFSKSNGELKKSTPKSWKMKIYIAEKGNDTDEDKSDSVSRDDDAQERLNESDLNEDVVMVNDDKENNRSFLRHHRKNSKSKIEETGSDVIVIDDKEHINDVAIIDKVVKLAPIFIKKPLKRKLDAAALEARKNFLMSGIPDVMKKKIERQLSYQDHEIFPTVSHIQQRDNSSMWNLNPVCLPVSENVSYTCSDLELTGRIFTQIETNNIKILTEPQKESQNIKQLLQNLKKSDPGYPIYKVYRQLCCKVCNSQEAEMNSSMWTEKYKPLFSEEIIGNSNAVKELKTWLNTWVQFSKEVKTKKYNSSSSCDFSDGESNDIRIPANTVIVVGPNGSGKTCTIYAVCNDFNINVIEVNASSRRTGKMLLQELHEATQSHRVTNDGDGKTEDSKLSLILIEDVDIVFEDHDDGFISALTSLVTTSKRPVILVSSDSKCSQLQRFTAQYSVIKFHSLAAKTIVPWLQLLCLVENVHISKNRTVSLLEENRGDMRKTVLELQFWVQGNACLSKPEILDLEDDSSNLSLASNEEGIGQTVIKNITICTNFPSGPIYLGQLWYKMSSIFEEKIIENSVEYNNLENLLDCASLVDVFLTNSGTECDLEPAPNPWQVGVTNGLSVEENFSEYTSGDELSKEIGYYLLEENLRIINKLPQSHYFLDKKRSRLKSHSAINNLMEAVSLSYHKDYTALASDYQPYLRAICRTEQIRQEANTKRRNRFYHYLKGFNIDCSPTTQEIFCSAFKVNHKDMSNT